MFKLVSSIKSVAAYLVVLLLTLFALPAFAGTASLAWNASASTTVTGYKVHYGTASGAYANHLDAGKVLSLTVPSLTAGTKYYFAVTAYNSAGESGYSNEASATIPAGTTAPVASFTSTPTTLTGAAPLNATFTSTSTGTISTYAWNFGDGSSATTANASHTYTTAGTYTVSLTVTNSAGSNTTSKTISVTAGTTALTASFTATPTSGNAPLATTFTATGSSGLTTFAWDFGDGAQGSGAKVSHTYTASGNFTVTLKASGTAGSAPTVTKTNFIQTGNALNAAFGVNRTSGVAPMRVKFDDQSSGTINSYKWTFGDGTTGTGPTPTHTYRKPGTYTAKLSVTGPAGTSPEKAVTINVAAANDVVVDFGDGVGIYTYANNAATPTLLTSVAAKKVYAVDIDRNGQTRVLVDHGTGRSRTGLWLYKADGTAPTQIDSRSAVSLVVGDVDGNGIDDVIADFGSVSGIVWFHDLSPSNRSQIDTRTAKQIVLWDENEIHDDMPELFASFAGVGIEMYSFANGQWYSYDPQVPVWMATADINHNGYDDLVIDFGPGPSTTERTGIWTLFDGAAGWKQLDVNSGLRGIKADFDSYNYDDLVVDFGTGTGQKVKTGLWALYNGSTWGKIHPNDTTKSLVAADVDGDGKRNVVADFGANKGIWQVQSGATWVKIDSRSANSMAAGQFK